MTIPRLLLVGWDAADWKVINPLLARGEMPNLARLMSEGVHGNLATIHPPLSPMVWTSIATGKRPPKHGIHGFTEPTPDGLSVRPVSILGRQTKAFWNILNQEGKRPIVVGWWPSHPAEPLRGAMVSNHFPFMHQAPATAKMADGTVWPESLASSLEELRVHAGEITGDILRLFVPEGEKVDQEKDRSLYDLAAIIAETMSIHAAGTEIMATVPWDMAAVYFTGIDHFSHRFMQYHAHKVRARKQQTDPELFADIIANAYRYHDVMLGRLRQLAGADCPVLVLSDHGFHSDRLLPDYIPAEAAGPAVEHREFGIFCLRAPGVLKGERIYGASVLDIAPTILHLFGLPAGEDMDGKVLINAFEDRTLPKRIPSWDDVPGEDGRHPPSKQYDAEAAAESLKQLVALGYIAPPDADQGKNVEHCVAECRYNLGVAQIDAGRPDLAAEIFEDLLRKDAEDRRYYQQLFQCRFHQGDLAAAARVMDDFDRACAEFAPRARTELERLAKEKSEEELQKLPKQALRAAMFRRRMLAEKASGYSVERLLLRCRLSLAESRTKRKKAAARELLEELAKAAGRNAGPALFLAEGFAAVGDPDRAMEYLRRARRSDPEDWRAISLEARIHHTAGRHEKAVESAVDSLALVYFQPPLHCLLAASLWKLGDEARAEQEYRVALAQAPGFPQAHEQLAALLRRKKGRTGEAGLHLATANVLRQRAKERLAAVAQKPEKSGAAARTEEPPVFERAFTPPADRSRVVAIVTGLPRSGTSMMMQMLAAAGIDPYTDEKRAADEDNPRGYFEHEQATQLHRDTSWIPAARGKVVKVVAQLLPYLPPGEEYRLVFMHRNLDEVTASQRAMLKRLKRKGGQLPDRELKRAYVSQLVRVQNWLQSRPEIAVLSVKYDEALADPDGAAARLAEFLGTPFDAGRAAASVDAGLRRQKAG
ncbi:MAG TPA: alkaline phosphatase family protein [Bryobacteraceae bacterium]